MPNGREPPDAPPPPGGAPAPTPAPGGERDPARYAAIFRRFVDEVAAEAAAAGSPLLDRVVAHLGADPTHLPVIAEEFDAFEQPNVQVALAPAMVVLEDVDLIAEERMRPGAGGPLLFELLNEMDGLGDDQDVIFVLTTNRPDILEPALAARPGRIDLAVELPLPDAEGRRRLLQLYARGLRLEGVDLDAVVARTDGVSPAYVKELLRKAALLAAEEAGGAEGAGRPGGPGAPPEADPTPGGISVRQAHLAAAMEELSQGGRLAERLLGFRPAEAAGAAPAPAGPAVPAATGFPRPAGRGTTGRMRGG